MRETLEQVYTQLPKKVNHVHEHPVLDIHFAVALPPVKAIDLNRISTWRVVQVFAGVSRLYSSPQPGAPL